jgi:hypothetical protein
VKPPFGLRGVRASTPKRSPQALRSARAAAWQKVRADAQGGALWRLQVEQVTFWCIKLVSCYYGTALLMGFLASLATGLAMDQAIVGGRAMANLLVIVWVPTRGVWGLWNSSPFVRTWRAAFFEDLTEASSGHSGAG